MIEVNNNVYGLEPMSYYEELTASGAIRAIRKHKRIICKEIDGMIADLLDLKEKIVRTEELDSKTFAGVVENISNNISAAHELILGEDIEETALRSLEAIRGENDHAVSLDELEEMSRAQERVAELSGENPYAILSRKRNE